MASGPLILAFSGGIGSGKSTLSSGVAEALEWSRVSFGRYVRAVALDRGLDAESREVLQEVGESLITAGWVPFCRAVLTQADWRPERSLVVDGIRHVEALQTLRALVAPSVVALVHVVVSEAERSQRLRDKGFDDIEKLRLVEVHSTEIQVTTSLPAHAAVTVDGRHPEQDLIDKIVRWVRFGHGMLPT